MPKSNEELICSNVSGDSKSAIGRACSNGKFKGNITLREKAEVKAELEQKLIEIINPSERAKIKKKISMLDFPSYCGAIIKSGRSESRRKMEIFDSEGNLIKKGKKTKFPAPEYIYQYPEECQKIKMTKSLNPLESAKNFRFEFNSIYENLETHEKVGNKLIEIPFSKRKKPVDFRIKIIKNAKKTP